MIHTWNVPCRFVGRGWGPIKLSFPIHEIEELDELATNPDNESDYADPVCPDDTLNFIPALLADLICFERIDGFRQTSKTPSAFLYEMDKSRNALEELNGSIVEYAHFAHRSLAVFKHDLASTVNEHFAHGIPKDLPWARALSEAVSYTEKLYSADPNDRERILAERPEENLRELGSEKLRNAFYSAFYRIVHHNEQNNRSEMAEHEDGYEWIYSALRHSDAHYAYLSSGLEAAEGHSRRLLTERQKVIWLASALKEDATPYELTKEAFSYASGKYREELWRIATSDPLSEAASDIRKALSETSEDIQNYFSNRFPPSSGGIPKKGCAALIAPYSKRQKLIVAFNGVADDDQDLTVNGVKICEYFNKRGARASTLHNLDMLLKSNAFNRKYDVARVHTDNLCVIEKPHFTSCVSLGEVMHAVKPVPNGSSKQMIRMFSCAERKAIAFANRERQQCDTFEGYLYASRGVCFICDWTIDYYNHQSNCAKGLHVPLGFNLKVDSKQPACPTTPDSLRLQAFHGLSIRVGAGHTGLTFKCP